MTDNRDETYGKGDRPGRGAYMCVYSNDTVRLGDDKNELPACPNVDCLIAHETRWTRLGER